MIASLNRFDNRRIVTVANWLLIAVCALMALRIAVVLVDGVRVDFEPIPFSSSPARARSLPESDWRMFGDPSEPDYGFVKALPPTPLSLRLRGVVTGERGYAIIVDADGNEGVYRAGDEVPGAAEVLTIEARRVVLERDGNREALELPGAGDTVNATVSSRPRAETEARPGLSTGVGIGSLSSLTSGFSLDPAELARRITILPVAGGGFRVRAGRDAAIFAQLGFHANDIVLAINGQPVDNQADVRAVFESFRPGEPLAITVRRGERQLVLTPGMSGIGGSVSP